LLVFTLNLEIHESLNNAKREINHVPAFCGRVDFDIAFHVFPTGINFLVLDARGLITEKNRGQAGLGYRSDFFEHHRGNSLLFPGLRKIGKSQERQEMSYWTLLYFSKIPAISVKYKLKVL